MKTALITRTFNQIKATCLKVDIDTRTVSETYIMIDSKYNTVEKAESYFRKHDTTVVSVLSVEAVNELRGMTENDFIVYGTLYDSRSKENRGMISKEVTLCSTSVMAVNDNREIVDTEFIGNLTDKQARKLCSENGLTFVKINYVTESKQLICMTVSDFIVHSRPMADRFRLA